MSKYREITNAEYARMITAISRIAARASESVAQGMWNPSFCDADAETGAIDRIAEIIAHYRNGGYRAMAFDKERGWYDTSLKEVSHGS